MDTDQKLDALAQAIASKYAPCIFLECVLAANGASYFCRNKRCPHYNGGCNNHPNEVVHLGARLCGEGCVHLVPGLPKITWGK